MYSRVQELGTSLPILQMYPDQQEKHQYLFKVGHPVLLFLHSKAHPELQSCGPAMTQQRLTPSL